ncbi:MAG: VanZ family protein [Anaerorhabdus sp.]
MKNRIISIISLLLFFIFNILWITKHTRLMVIEQIALVILSVTFYLVAAFFEVNRIKDLKKKSVVIKTFALFLLLYYLFFIATVVFLDGYFFSRGASFASNKIFFKTIKSYMIQFSNGRILVALGNLIGNAILLVPLALLLPMLNSIFKKWYVFLFTTTFISAFIEYQQFKLSLGSADVDDILLNVFGSFVAFLLFQGVIDLFGFKNNNLEDNPK